MLALPPVGALLGHGFEAGAARQQCHWLVMIWPAHWPTRSTLSELL
jgi:hypothetical protein